MRKKQDIMWEQSTLWELVEKWVTKFVVLSPVIVTPLTRRFFSSVVPVFSPI